VSVSATPPTVRPIVRTPLTRRPSRVTSSSATSWSSTTRTPGRAASRRLTCPSSSGRVRARLFRPLGAWRRRTPSLYQRPWSWMSPYRAPWATSSSVSLGRALRGPRGPWPVARGRGDPAARHGAAPQGLAQVPVDHGDAPVGVGQHPCRRQPGHAGPEHHGVVAGGQRRPTPRRPPGRHSSGGHRTQFQNI